MPKLTPLEKEQNQQFLSSLLQSFNFPPTLSCDETQNIIQEICDEYGIWLKGINQLIAKEMAARLKQAINTGKPDEIRNVCAALQKALTEENLILRRQFSSSANGLRAPEATISANIQAKKAISSSYWLQEEDITLALETLRKIDGVYINQPVSFIDTLLKKQVENQIRDQNVKIALIPVCANQHWTLSIFKVNAANNKIESYSYNPLGDGKCGDHVIRKAYREVAETLNTNTAYGTSLNHSDANSARQTTIDLIKANVAVNAEEKVLPESDVLAASKITASKAVNATTLQKSSISQSGVTVSTKAEMNNRYFVWNKKANLLLDRIANQSDQEKAIEWKKFIDEFEKDTEQLTQNKKVSCSAEAEETHIKSGINSPISTI